jgi:hypothetical protein
MELGAFAFSIITNLLSSVIFEGTNFSTLSFFQRRKIERRIEDATAEVVEPLLPFLAHEGISEDKQRRLIETCVEELRPLTEKPEQLFQGSLNGQKIFDDLYANRNLPQVVIEDGLKDVYTLLCPRVATLLCKIPVAVKDWESEAWSENFRRFDEITNQLRTLFNRVDELAASPSRDADTTLTVVRRTLAQKIRLELDLTGLRADRPLAGKFDNFFVHPQIKEEIKSNADKKQARVVGEPDESFDLFTLRSHRAIVIGQPGAGKSTWAKWLQREALSTRWTGICVRVELRRFSSEALLSLHELIREAAGQHLAEELTGERIGEWLKAKHILFILDGFDEIRPSERDKVYDWIVELNTAVRECSFILTSRPLTTDHVDRLSTSWQCWTIEPFDEERIVDYIQRWYTHTPLLLESNHEVNAVALAASWRQDPTIGPLTGNPLLLSTLLMVHHLDGNIPSGRSQLYRRYVEGMLGLWDDRRKVAATTVQLSLEEKRQIMRGFALKMFLQGRDQLDEPAALELVQGLLQKINVSLPEEDVLAGLRERSGLIIGPGIYSFVHKSVAEYLVAESVLQGDQRDETGRRIDRFCLFEHRDNDRWNTVTFLWSGLAPLADVESFIDECINIRAWNLAYGILNDQYDRFTKEIRRRLLLEIISVDQSLVDYEKNVYWGCSYSKGKFNKLNIPTFELRSLVSNHERFHRLVSRALEDSTIVWSDSANAEGEIRDLLWMCCTITVRTIDEWKTCLIAPCPKSAPSVNWLYWVAERVFNRAVVQRKNTPDIEAIVEAYKDVCPHARGLLPIALISTVVRLGISRFYSRTNSNYDNYAAILKILSNSDPSEVMQDWLVGTREWNLLDHDKHIKDLLTVFTQQIKKLVKQGALNRDAVYERAINFVEELPARREAISSSSSGDNPSA